MGEAKRRRLAEAKARAEAAAAAPVEAFGEEVFRLAHAAAVNEPLHAFPCGPDGRAPVEEILGVPDDPPPPVRALPKGIVLAQAPIPLGPLGAMPRISLRLPPPPTTPGPRGRKR